MVTALASLRPATPIACAFTPKTEDSPQDEIGSREQTFSDFDVEMLALSTGKIERTFLNLEVFRNRPHLSADARQRCCQKGMVMAQETSSSFTARNRPYRSVNLDEG